MQYNSIYTIRFIALFVVAVVSQRFAAAADFVSDRITVAVRGHGPDVIFIPGLASSSAVWDGAAGNLENHFRLHIVQIAGFAGQSSRANAQGSILQPTMDAIDAYIKTNQLKSPKVIGHSLGGLLGAMLAIQHPEDVSGLMIVDALPFYGAVFGAEDPAAITTRASIMRDNLIAQTQGDYAKSETAFMRVLVKSPEGCKQATQWAIASDKSVVARAMYEDMITDIRPQLEKIKAPVTVLHAWDSSTRISREASDELYEQNYSALLNKKIVRIDDSFHFIMLDQPEKFAAEVDQFLK
jgi:pimeloyl-ACP methyl ester carboxylesterase